MQLPRSAGDVSQWGADRGADARAIPNRLGAPPIIFVRARVRVRGDILVRVRVTVTVRDRVRRVRV
jgi:hypothetical protein